MIQEKTIIAIASAIGLWTVSLIEPQIAGILGAFAYLIVMHETNIHPITIRKVFVLGFFGWLGAWIVVNIFHAHYPETPFVWCQIASGTVGFLAYDTIMMFGKNSKSVIGFIADIGKTAITEGVRKWKS